MTSLSRSTVSTALAELVRRKWLRTGYRSIEILDHDAIDTFLGPSDFPPMSVPHGRIVQTMKPVGQSPTVSGQGITTRTC